MKTENMTRDELERAVLKLEEELAKYRPVPAPIHYVVPPEIAAKHSWITDETLPAAKDIAKQVRGLMFGRMPVGKYAKNQYPRPQDLTDGQREQYHIALDAIFETISKYANLTDNGRYLTYYTEQDLREARLDALRKIVPTEEQKEIMRENELVNRINYLPNCIPIEELVLSVRAFNALKRSGIDTVGDIVAKTEDELIKTRNLGYNSLNEIKSILRDMGLFLKEEDTDDHI